MIEQYIHEHIWAFDLQALMRVLQYYGYHEIWFRSHDNLTSEPRLIEAIEFIDVPDATEWHEPSLSETSQEHKTVILTLNMGLLGPQSPLPSYTRQLRDTLMDKVEEFNYFIGFFDHWLIQYLVQQLYPELNASCFGHWQGYQARMLQLKNLTSRRGLHMLFDYVFPECEVRCDWHHQQRWQAEPKQYLGQIQLGENYYLGDVHADQFRATRVYLDNAHSGLTIDTLRERLYKHILPACKDLRFYLDVRVWGVNPPLSTSNRSQSMKGATPLGFHPLASEPAAGWVVLFAGRPCEQGRCQPETLEV